MEVDANEYALSRYLDKMERMEKLYERFLVEIDDDLRALEDTISFLKTKAKDYYGYDFSDDLDYALKEIL